MGGDHERRTRTPLATWFATIWFVTSQKNGVAGDGHSWCGTQWQGAASN